jgi:hypothetical protein
VVFQDWQLTQGQRICWHSRGYQEPCFAAQETRVHRFHEVLNDIIWQAIPRAGLADLKPNLFSIPTVNDNICSGNPTGSW